LTYRYVDAAAAAVCQPLSAALIVIGYSASTCPCLARLLTYWHAGADVSIRRHARTALLYLGQGRILTEYEHVGMSFSMPVCTSTRARQGSVGAGIDTRRYAEYAGMPAHRANGAVLAADIDTSGIASIWHVSTPSEAGETCWLNIDTSVCPVCRYASTPSEAERCWLRLSIRRYASMPGMSALRRGGAVLAGIDTSVCQYAGMSAPERGRAVLIASVCRRCRYVSTPSEAGQCWLSIDTSVCHGMPVCLLGELYRRMGRCWSQCVDTSIHRYVNRYVNMCKDISCLSLMPCAVSSRRRGFWWALCGLHGGIVRHDHLSADAEAVVPFYTTSSIYTYERARESVPSERR
jgi:hypothetical protein